MTDVIKTRIEAIKKGELPEGYKKTKAGIMPEDWDGAIRAKQLFKSHTNKKHNGDLEILASTQDRGIVPRNQIGIDIQCSDEGVKGYKKVSKGDFVISLRSFQGGIEYSEYDGIVSPAYTVLKPIKDISTGFYRNYFKTDSFIDRLDGAVYGIRDGKQIGYEDFGDMYVHYPPLAEQERIAEILMQCDKVIELKQKRIVEEKKKKEALMRRLLRTSKEALHDSALAVGKEGTLKDVVSYIESGTSVNSIDKAAEYVSEKRYVLKTSAIFEGTFLLEESKEVVAEDYYRVSCPIEANTLLVSRMNTPKLVGACALCDVTLPNVFLPDRLWKVVLKKNVDPRWLNYVISSESSQRSIRRKAGGTSNSMKNISQKDFLDIPIVLPSYDEQVSIANIIAAVDVVIKKLYEEIGMWGNKKRALMQMLLTGIVRVKV